MDRDSEYVSAALFEHRFWLQILGDHARFIYTSLSPMETEELGRAKAFITTFDSLLETSRGNLSEAQLSALNQKAYESVKELRAYKLHILQRHLVGEIGISLPPTFLNHMVNELDEYMRILAFLVSGEALPVYHPVHHHLLWLLDAAGHSSAITANLDRVEKRLMEKGMVFTKHFEDYYLKAIEIAGYLRANVQQFPALARFNKEVELEILLFKQFLHEIEEMDVTNTLLDILSPLMPDHMAREECYYLMKLAQTADVKMPQCDPTKPRIKE